MRPKSTAVFLEARWALIHVGPGLPEIHGGGEGGRPGQGWGRFSWDLVYEHSKFLSRLELVKFLFVSYGI